MSTHLIPDRGPLAEREFHITPHMIDTAQHFWDAFGHDTTEVSASYIVRLMQIKGGWVPFSMEGIATFFHQSPRAIDFPFNRLVNPGMVFYIERGHVVEGGGWVVMGEDGLYRVTEDFVERCHKSAPAKMAQEGT